MDTPQYQVLARRYRPQCFSDVVGHEAVLQTLKNSVRRGTVAHAYLFSGSRGVGKTTLARLFAKLLNCSNLQENLEPCNQCPSCLDVTSAQSLDVIEIEGASNRGIDDIRQINETVGFAPSYGRYKITLIDEVHMLTKEAFNALLKTLEEPPERAKFFFATTEPHKIPPTILSRCQRFDLGRLMPAQILQKLQTIAKDLARPTSEEAFHLIAKAADGSLRDAESLFDQILCFAGPSVTAADARHVLGLASDELFFGLDLAFSEARVSYAFELTEKLFQAGLHLGSFLTQLIEHYRHLLVCKTLSPASLDMPQEIVARYAASAQLYAQSQCFAALDLCLKAEAHFSTTLAPRTTFELLLLQIIRTKHRIPIEALVRRLSDLETSILAKDPSVDPLATASPREEIKASPPQAEVIAPPREELKATPPPPVVVAPPAPREEVREEVKSAPPVVASAPTPAPGPKHQKHPSHYDTLIRFTAVELEGTVIKT